MLRIRCGRREGGGRIDAGTSAGALQAVRTAMVALAGGIGKDIFGLVCPSFAIQSVANFLSVNAKDDDRLTISLKQSTGRGGHNPGRSFANCAATTMGVRYLLGGASVGSTHGWDIEKSVNPCVEVHFRRSWQTDDKWRRARCKCRFHDESCGVCARTRHIVRQCGESNRIDCLAGSEVSPRSFLSGGLEIREAWRQHKLCSVPFNSNFTAGQQ